MKGGSPKFLFLSKRITPKHYVDNAQRSSSFPHVSKFLNNNKCYSKIKCIDTHYDECIKMIKQIIIKRSKMILLLTNWHHIIGSLNIRITWTEWKLYKDDPYYFYCYRSWSQNHQRDGDQNIATLIWIKNKTKLYSLKN